MLIKFKKGAFAGLNSVQPIMIKYNCPFMNTESGVFPMLEHTWLSAAVPWVSVEVIELPVFTPNEYFFNQHRQGGEEKWETFQRVIRNLMSEHSGLPLAEIDIEDKYRYKSLIFKDENRNFAE
jgi:hypothetical protein